MTIKDTLSGLIGRAPREPSAVRVLLHDASRGEAHAQSALGDIYRKGSLIPKDHAQAAKWYRLAAEQGDAHAQFNLGALTMAGLGVAQDDAAAVAWYRLAADQGDALAQFNLGVMYSAGRGVARDYIEACKWFNVAASRGVGTAASGLERIEQFMTPIQIIDARERARDWKPRAGR